MTILPKGLLGGLLAAFLFACPALADFAQTSAPTETTDASPADATPAISLSPVVDAGDLLLMFVSDEGGVSFVSGPSGWTDLWQAPIQGSSADALVSAKVADGTEDGTTVDVTYSSTPQGVAAQVYRITDWYGDLSGVEVGSEAGGSNDSPNPPSLTPSWGATDTLWIAHTMTRDDGADVTAAPSNYGNLVSTVSGATANEEATVGTARRELNSTSDNPDAFTLSETEDWAANVVAIRPLVPGTPSTTGRIIILEGDFVLSTYATDYDWNPGSPTPTDSKVTLAATTLNGHDAIAATWEAGAEADSRFLTRMDLPLIAGFEDGYPEVFATFEIQFNSNFSNPKGWKGPVVQTDPRRTSAGCGDDGGSISANLTATGADTTGSRNMLQRTFHVGDAGDANDWTTNPSIPLDEVAIIELHYKINTASGVSDGIAETRYDQGRTSGRPESIVQQQTNLQYWCSPGTEDGAYIKQVWQHIFPGGPADPSWAPTIDTTIVFGHFKVEIPDDSWRARVVTHLNRIRQAH